MHFLLFSAVTLALYVLYYTIKILIWIVKFIAKKTCLKKKSEIAPEDAKVADASKKPVDNKKKDGK